MQSEKTKVLGDCPICDRTMLNDGFSTNKHHFVPKSRGGKETETCHRVCHSQIHALWTEKQLEKEFSDPEIIKADPRMQKFIAWVKKKEPDFYIKTISSNIKRQKY